jgi:hypothetical protein
VFSLAAKKPVFRRASNRAAGGDSVEADSPAGFAGAFLLLALDGCSLFAFTFLRGLFVEFPATKFGQNPRLFASALETPEGGVKMLVFSYSNAGQGRDP